MDSISQRINNKKNIRLNQNSLKDVPYEPPLLQFRDSMGINKDNSIAMSNVNLDQILMPPPDMPARGQGIQNLNQPDDATSMSA